MISLSIIYRDRKEAIQQIDASFRYQKAGSLYGNLDIITARPCDIFCKPLETLIPILFLGSKEDRMYQTDLIDEYQHMNQLVSNGEIHIFDHGDHPAIATNASEFAEIQHF